jgi:hypothetical protein
MATTMQNNIRGASNYDATWLLADTQAVTTDVAGKDSGGSALYIDLQDYVGSNWVAHIRYTQAQFTDETYKFEVQSSSGTSFSTYNVEKNTDLGIAADVAASSNKYFLIGAFSPTQRYVRIYFNTSGSAPSLTVDKVWISPLG